MITTIAAEAGVTLCPGPQVERGVRGWGQRLCAYGNDTCLNLAMCRHYMTNDIILPWKESWWKFAAGSQLPTGGCRALWLEKYFFHWQILFPEPFSFFFLHTFYTNFALYIRLQTVSAIFFFIWEYARCVTSLNEKKKARKKYSSH